jgi:hypothetical protein
MTYATLRFKHLGWRVIKLEPTPVPGRKSRGDPNRYIGRPTAGEDRHSYFVAPNLGKEAIAIDLKRDEGQRVMKQLITKLEVDVFCTNTMPGTTRCFRLCADTWTSQDTQMGLHSSAGLRLSTSRPVTKLSFRSFWLLWTATKPGRGNGSTSRWLR